MVMVDGCDFLFSFWLYHFFPFALSLVCSNACNLFFRLPGCVHWHSPVTSDFLWADIMYLSASYIPLPSSKYAIIPSQLTLLNTSHIISIVVYNLDLLTAYFLLICLLAFNSYGVRIPKTLSHIRIAFSSIICMSFCFFLWL